MMLYSTFLVVTFASIFGSCLDYPDDWRGSTWKDGFSGSDVSFTDNGMSGMAVNVVGKLINQWTCFLKRNDMVVSRSVSLVRIINVDSYVYICQKYKRISNSFYSYYLMSKENVLTSNNTRVYTKGSTSTITEICEVCNNGGPKPSDSDYYVMRKDGGSTNINLTGLYPMCAVVGCNQCTSAVCSSINITCSPSSRATSGHSRPVYATFVCAILVGVLINQRFGDAVYSG